MTSLTTSLFIFDIDGTLTDSASMYLKVVTQALENLGIQNIDTDYNNYKHHTDSYALRYNYKRSFGKNPPIDLLTQFELGIITAMKTVNRTKEIVGARAMIESLRQNKVPFSFATGALPKPAIAKLQQCDIWYDEALLATSKTHESREGFVKDAIVRAKKYYNRNNFDRIISVGDGVWDMKTAHNLNLDFVGIGSKYASYFKNNGVKECYEDMNTFSRTLMSKT